MAHTSTTRASRRPVASMSPNQLQAYLVARETLRRLKPTPTPWVPPEFPPPHRDGRARP